MKTPELATALNVPTSKLKEIASEIFGFIPVEWDESQISSIKAAIQNANMSLALPPTESLNIEKNPGEPTDINVIKENLKVYLQELNTLYTDQITEINQILFKTEQEFYGRLHQHQSAIQSQTLNRLKANSNYWSSKTLSSLNSGDNDDLDQLLNIWNL